MASKDIKLKDDSGNYLFPLSHKDDDGNVIKFTYIKNSYKSQIVKDVSIVYAKNSDENTPPDDSDFDEILKTSGEYLWQCLKTTYLNGNVCYSSKANLTYMLNYNPQTSIVLDNFNLDTNITELIEVGE